MSIRQVCVRMLDGRFAAGADGRLPGYLDDDAFGDLGRRADAAGDPGAVLIAPVQRVGSDPAVMLSVFASRSVPPGGDAAGPLWLRPELVAESAPVRAALHSVLRSATAASSGSTAAPELRPDWFRAGWYDDVEAWLDVVLSGSSRRTGPVEPIKVWSLSAVLRVPTRGGPRWFKASCAHFGAEPGLTSLVAELAPRHAPEVIAIDAERGWTLLGQLDGADEDLTLTPELAAAAAEAIAALQLASLDRLDAARSAGAPERGLAATGAAFDAVLADGVELDQLGAAELDAARACRPRVHALLDRLAASGIPDTLVHGDLHPGNVAPQPGGVIIYDWSDAAIGPPLCDLVMLVQRLEPAASQAAVAAYRSVWHRTRPELDLAAALDLAAPVTTIYQLISYEQIYRSQESASRWELAGVTARLLRELPAQQSEPRTVRAGG